MPLDKKNIDKISDEVSQNYEEAVNTIQMTTNKQLLKYLKDPNYASKQSANLKKVRDKIFKISLMAANKSNKALEYYIKESLKNVDQETRTKSLERLKTMQNQNRMLSLTLFNTAYQAHQRFISEIGLKPGQTYELGSLEKSQLLYEQASKVLTSKTAEESYSVTYKNGREYSFKSYMEMNMRTTLTNEIREQQLSTAIANGEVFYISNTFPDCRPSHADLQGKIFYNEDYLSMGFDEEYIQKIEDAIASKNMVSRQSVENNEPYFCSSPNCRHEFIPVPLEDVVSMSNKELHEENNCNYTRASEEKYKNSQKQRYYERQIRAHKVKIEKYKEILEKAPKGVDTAQIKAKLNDRKETLQENYKEIRELVKNNSYLERDYTRENAKILRNV
jgi:hypothetical protein